MLEKLTPDALKRIIPILLSLKERGMAIVYITHRIEDIYGFAERVAILRDGVLLTIDSVNNLDKIMLLKLAYTQLSQSGSTDEATSEYFHLVKYNEAILKELPVNLIIVDTTLSIRLMNDFSKRFFGIGDEDNLARSMDTLFPGECIEADQEGTYRDIKEALLNRREQTFLNFRALLNNEYRTVTISTCPISDGGEWIGGMLLLNDVTTQEMLREQVVLSEKLSSIGMLAAGVAHEINNPLEIIYNYLDFIKARLKTKKAQGVLQSIQEEMNSIKEIVGGLVTFSDGKQPQIETVDVCAELRGLVNLVSISAKHGGVKMILSLKKKNILIYANKNELKQVFLNLIKNSLEAMPGGGQLAISAAVEPGTERLQALITFQDSGSGIRSSNTTDVFLPFYSTKLAKGNNLGLGLSITYNIVKKYRGLITVENTPPKGCTFTLRFPIEHMLNI